MQKILHRTFFRTGRNWIQEHHLRCAALVLFVLLGLAAPVIAADLNLLTNPGFEEPASGQQNPPGWVTATDGAGRIVSTSTEVHQGQNAISIPANTSVEQTIRSAPEGAYLARCWVKSDSAQTVTFFLRNPEEPWASYTCAELKVPKGQWVQLEAFCALDRSGPLTLSLGGVPKDFHPYHGTGEDMAAPIIADDFELFRYEPKPSPGSTAVAVWDAAGDLTPDWSAKERWSPVDGAAHRFSGAPVIQARHLVGALRKSDGGVTLYSLQSGKLQQRCIIAPVPAITGSKYTLVQDHTRTGIRVSSEDGSRSYLAWFTAEGLLRVESTQVPRFTIQQCRLRYGLLPSFAGTDICYAPGKMPPGNEFKIPSTQWFVGLVDGNDSMLVAAWETNSQPVSLGLSGEGEKRLIDSLSIGCERGSFGLSFVDHGSLWHRELLNEDWLGEYAPIQWQRPFPARWMAHFTVSPGGQPSFRQPDLDYSFPFAYAKTRMWGVWFEDWNHYPFYFDGQRTMFHFEKTFIPQGEALIYFLEPAATDLFSPSEIVEQFLGVEKAQALFDFEANRLRKLKYSTPDRFILDRPVCATTTRLSKIKQEEKPTLGLDLATHLYEFIREIRGRVDQYSTFFKETNDYLAAEATAHPETRDYVAELQKMVSQAQEQSQEIYATPLSAVEKKIEAMKIKLREGGGDGFDCGNLDVRAAAGAQDDLCRWYNRRVIKLTQTAARTCGGSSAEAAIALHIWDQSRAVLRRPTRWEARRTLYFFEP